MNKTCIYFFAPQSPWTYLGHQRFVEMAKKYDVQVEVKPCDLSKVFSTSGGLPLAKRPPQRQAYRLIELKRWSEHLNLPMNLHPKFFPVTGDAAAKLIIATQLAHGNDAALAIAGSIMRAVWVEESNVADIDTLQSIANSHGFDGKALVQSSELADVENQYQRFTEEALKADIFGAPWYVVDGEPFWGQDRLDFVEKAFAK